MRATFAGVLCTVALAFGTTLNAQVRITPVVGYVHPAKQIGIVHAANVEAMPHAQFVVMRKGSPLVGVRLSGPLGPSRLGWEASILRSWTRLESNPLPRMGSELRHNSVARNESPISFRIAATFGPDDGMRGRLFAGPAVILAGEDWLRPGFAEWAAVGGLGAIVPLVGGVELDLQVENYSYTTWGNRWQHDVGVNVGIVLGSPSR